MLFFNHWEGRVFVAYTKASAAGSSAFQPVYSHADHRVGVSGHHSDRFRFADAAGIGEVPGNNTFFDRIFYISQNNTNKTTGAFVDELLQSIAYFQSCLMGDLR